MAVEETAVGTMGEGNPTVDEKILCEKVAIQHESIPYPIAV